MKKLYRWVNDLFSPKQLQGLDAMELLDAMNDPVIRKEWLYQVFEELKRLNLEVDHRLLNGGYGIDDLSARRSAYQAILEWILSAKRSITMGRNHNQAVGRGEFDLNSVTVQPSPK